MFEANALDQVAQLALGRLAVVSGETPIVGCARQAREAAQVLYVSMGVGCLRCHGFDNCDDADTGLPCVAGRSNARKAFRKKSMSICWRPTSRSSSAMRAFACASAERLSSYVGRGLSFRGLGLGPGLRFNPSGPWTFHALIQSCKSLRAIPSSRATGRTPSPRSTRLIAFSFVSRRKLTVLSSYCHRSS